MASKKEVAVLEELVRKIRAVIDAQAVLRDGMVDMRKYLRIILEKMEELEATSEVVKLSLKRKIDIEDINILQKRIIDVERKFSSTVTKY